MKVIIFCVIIFIITYIIVISSHCTLTKIFEINSNKPGPTILILAGTHGDEPASSYYFDNIIRNTKLVNLKKGKLIIIPRVNDCAVKFGIRSMPLIGDINRKYYDNNTNHINQQIINIIKNNKIDFVLDFHEGYDFHKINEESLGSTITSTNDLSGIAKNYGEKIVKNLNESINEPLKKFTLLSYDYKPIDGTLIDYLSSLHISGILIETSGQNDIQPLKIRLNQIDLIFKSIILLFHL